MLTGAFKTIVNKSFKKKNLYNFYKKLKKLFFYKNFPKIVY